MPLFRTRILLVDDTPSSLIWQLVLLQEEQYDTLTASCPREGLRIARTERPDLVILDATTRHAEIVAAATQLRAEQATSHIRILVIVGSGRSRAADDFVSISDDRVTKPLDPAVYIQKIRELLGRRRRGSGGR